MYRLLIVLCAIIVSSSADDDLVVQIEDGKIQGTTTTNLDGELFYSFYGIPYAKPPTGELRFKPPVPVEPWNTTFNATELGECCIQAGPMGSEDCLQLNVHTKKLNSTELRPVMVWIHGGGFISGCNNQFGPEFLMTEDIVFVATNYRLGLLGFLSLINETLGISGNQGFKDQILALKWVQKNIINFGGDPNNVTIFGESAGGMSVHQQVLSDASKGLFQKAIIQSGAALDPWGIVKPVLAVKLGVFLNIENYTEVKLLERLNNYSVGELYSNQDTFLKGINQEIVIGPVIEYPNDSQFMTDSVLDRLKSGRYNNVPIMMGYNSNEGLLFELEKRNMIINDTVLLRGQTSHTGSIIPPEMNLQMNETWSSHIEKEIIEIYFKGKNANSTYLLIADYFFINGIIESAELHANTSTRPVYLYRMTLEAGRNYLKKLYHMEDFPGVSHADDLGYLFNMAGLETDMDEKDVQYIRTFVKLWTNFAKFGNPTPNVTDLGIEWKPLDENQYFMDIGEELTLQNNPDADRMRVWQEIYPDRHQSKV